jgi:peptidoglycan/xylan/chitin deacetylase (PgdA/CDA1 family)
LACIIIPNYQITEHRFDDSVFEFENHKRIVVAFRNDDLSVGSDFKHEKAVVEIFKKYGIKQTIGFIPAGLHTEKQLRLEQNQRVPIIDALKRWADDGLIEIGLHGFTHLKGHRTAGEFGGLSYMEQITRIQKGQAVVNALFKNETSIFIPPFNQADQNTYKACIDSDIGIFSAFWKEPFSDKLSFVNSNASLFPTKYGGIPDAKTIYNKISNTNGTAFLIIFYHSRTDFKIQADFQKLDRFLDTITHDPLVVVSTIGEIPEKFKKELAAYNLANTHLYSALRMAHLAKPYFAFAIRSYFLINDGAIVQSKIDEALSNYWRGNYKQSANLSADVMQIIKQTIVYSRILVLICCTGLSYIAFWSCHSDFFRKKRKTCRAIKVSLFLIPAVLIAYVHLWSPFSAQRTDQLYGLLALSSIGCVISLLASKLAFKNRY